MSKSIQYLTIVALIALILVAGGTTGDARSLNTDLTWVLLWSDEFNGSTVNTSDWVFDVGNGAWGWGNNELEYYTKGDNASIQDGALVIEARKENVKGYHYTSTRMKTKGKHEFLYGRIEARIALPMGQGLWPAFWMLGGNIDTVDWPASGEIDIMEHINNENTVYGTVHWEANNNQADYGCSLDSIDVTQYHIYDIEWDADTIKWHVDGVQYCEILIQDNTGDTEEFHAPFFILLNLAVGGNWPGSPTPETVFPAKMYVDYVRAYGVPLPPAAFNKTSPANASIRQPADPILEWAASAGATSYEYCYDTSNDNSCDTTWNSITNLSAPLSGLANDTAYYWQVRAINLGGVTYANSGAWWNFKVMIAPPIPNSPANGVTIHTRRPSFDWEDVSSATSYTIEASLTPTFSSKKINVTVPTSSYSATKDLSANTAYFWRVKANGPNGPSEYSEVWSFTTGNPPPIPKLVAPGNKKTVAGPSPLFDWKDVKAIAGVTFDHYEIQISTDANFSTTFDTGYPTDSQYAGFSLPSGTYYWRVRSVATNGDYSGWSQVRMVIIK